MILAAVLPLRSIGLFVLEDAPQSPKLHPIGESMPTTSSGAQAAPSGKPPLIDIDIGLYFDLPTLNRLCWQAIEEQNDPPTIFDYGSNMVRVRYDFHDDSPIIQAMSESIMRHELSEMGHWVRTKIDKKTGAIDLLEARPLKDVVQNVIASRVIPLPRLNRIVGVPVFAPDKTLITEPGYNKASGIIYAPSRGYKSLSVPDVITNTHIDDAKKLIEELICDFPFACDDAGDSPDHDNAIALLLLPFVRDLIEGQTPLHLFDAPMPGSGKGLLTQCLLWPAFGGITGFSLPAHDDELRKTITAMLVACRPVIWIDNVTRPINSEGLSSVLTLDVWDDRVLEGSVLANAKNRAVWVMTGNNITLTRDNARRSIRIRLIPQTDKPEERKGFKHKNLKGWVKQNRAELVWAAHVLCKNAIQQQLPMPKSQIVGSYEPWSEIMGSILECSGYSQFLGNHRVLLDNCNTKAQTLSLFALRWFEDFGDSVVTAGDLLKIAESIDGIINTKSDIEQARKSSLGSWLKSQHEIITEYNDSNDPSLTQSFRIIDLGIDKKGLRQRGVRIFQLEPLNGSLNGSSTNNGTLF